MFKKIKDLIIKYWEIISYLFWGVLTTVVSWGSYSILVAICQTEITITIFSYSFSLDIAISNALSWILAVVFAFVTNKIFVFKSKSWAPSVSWPEFLKFVSARIVTGVVEIVAVPLLVGFGLDQEIFGIEGSVSKIIVSVVVVILNYIFSKLFVFKKKSDAE